MPNLLATLPQKDKGCTSGTSRSEGEDPGQPGLPDPERKEEGEKFVSAVSVSVCVFVSTSCLPNSF